MIYSLAKHDYQFNSLENDENKILLVEEPGG